MHLVDTRGAANYALPTLGADTKQNRLTVRLLYRTWSKYVQVALYGYWGTVSRIGLLA